MNTISLRDYNVQEMSKQELTTIEGGSWGLVARVALRCAVGAAGLATGAAVVIGVGLLAWEVYEALK